MTPITSMLAVNVKINLRLADVDASKDGAREKTEDANDEDEETDPAHTLHTPAQSALAAARLHGNCDSNDVTKGHWLQLINTLSFRFYVHRIQVSLR